MAEIFKEKPKQGMPFCTPGLMDGLARLEYAVKKYKGRGMHNPWSGLGTDDYGRRRRLGGGGADFDAVFNLKNLNSQQVI